MKKFEIIYHNAQEETVRSVEDFISSWNDTTRFIETQTSGSTGKPKTIIIPKSTMTASAMMTDSLLNLKSLRSALLALNVNTIGGKMMIVRSIVFNLKLHVTEVSANPLAEIDEKIDFAAFVPFQLDRILDQDPEKLKTIKQVIVGGGKISEKLKDKLISNSLGVYETFGMTETTSHIALRKTGFQGEEYFTALGNSYFTVDHDDCLIINAPDLDILSLGTNDVVELKDSHHFKHLGRRDFVINSGGVKLFPEEIERKLEKQIEADFFISGIPDDKLGDKIALFIEGDIVPELNFDELEKYEKPREIYPIARFPKTKSGKIDRKKILKSFRK